MNIFIFIFVNNPNLNMQLPVLRSLRWTISVIINRQGYHLIIIVLLACNICYKKISLNVFPVGYVYSHL